MLVGSDSEEREVICGIQVSDSASGFPSQLLNKASILDSGSIVQGGPNWKSYNAREENNHIF